MNDRVPTPITTERYSMSEMSLSDVEPKGGVGVPSTQHRQRIVRVGLDTPRELTYPGVTPETSTPTFSTGAESSTMFTAETTPTEQRYRSDEQRSQLEAMSDG